MLNHSAKTVKWKDGDEIRCMSACHVKRLLMVGTVSAKTQDRLHRQVCSFVRPCPGLYSHIPVSSFSCRGPQQNESKDAAVPRDLFTKWRPIPCRRGADIDLCEDSGNHCGIIRAECKRNS